MKVNQIRVPAMSREFSFVFRESWLLASLISIILAADLVACGYVQDLSSYRSTSADEVAPDNTVGDALRGASHRAVTIEQSVNKESVNGAVSRIKRSPGILGRLKKLGALHRQHDRSQGGAAGYGISSSSSNGPAGYELLPHYPLGQPKRGTYMGKKWSKYKYHFKPGLPNFHVLRQRHLIEIENQQAGKKALEAFQKQYGSYGDSHSHHQEGDVHQSGTSSEETTKSGKGSNSDSKEGCDSSEECRAAGSNKGRNGNDKGHVEGDDSDDHAGHDSSSSRSKSKKQYKSKATAAYQPFLSDESYSVKGKKKQQYDNDSDDSDDECDEHRYRKKKPSQTYSTLVVRARKIKQKGKGAHTYVPPSEEHDGNSYQPKSKKGPRKQGGHRNAFSSNNKKSRLNKNRKKPNILYLLPLPESYIQTDQVELIPNQEDAAGFGQGDSSDDEQPVLMVSGDHDVNYGQGSPAGFQPYGGQQYQPPVTSGNHEASANTESHQPQQVQHSYQYHSQSFMQPATSYGGWTPYAGAYNVNSADQSALLQQNSGLQPVAPKPYHPNSDYSAQPHGQPSEQEDSSEETGQNQQASPGYIVPQTNYAPVETPVKSQDYHAPLLPTYAEPSRAPAPGSDEDSNQQEIINRGQGSDEDAKYIQQLGQDFGLTPYAAEYNAEQQKKADKDSLRTTRESGSFEINPDEPTTMIESNISEEVRIAKGKKTDKKKGESVLEDDRSGEKHYYRRSRRRYKLIPVSATSDTAKKSSKGAKGKGHDDSNENATDEQSHARGAKTGISSARPELAAGDESSEEQKDEIANVDLTSSNRESPSSLGVNVGTTSYGDQHDDGTVKVTSRGKPSRNKKRTQKRRQRPNSGRKQGKHHSSSSAGTSSASYPSSAYLNGQRPTNLDPKNHYHQELKVQPRGEKPSHDTQPFISSSSGGGDVRNADGNGQKFELASRYSLPRGKTTYVSGSSSSGSGPTSSSSGGPEVAAHPSGSAIKQGTNKDQRRRQRSLNNKQEKTKISSTEPTTTGSKEGSKEDHQVRQQRTSQEKLKKAAADAVGPSEGTALGLSSSVVS